ncbi:protein RALF-like 34 [Physcomitrium patens]|uniref:Uncharacterized protein n=1 Tax=Physcomitrium patens TaxID=3218 RepID=A0A2K1IDQ3_PHYPA|nr:protein RALF-like 34 [Physcomitrium patens]PNR27408.1 hypothetical protein PHYPA_029560 [Physcomitrium patens]|eukprot:XP_024364863.1 protein RALF-like 34 [Physcomitrella patens]
MAVWRSVLVVALMGLLVMGIQAEQQLGFSPGAIYPDAHRVLAAAPNYYISYGSLNADRAPCPASSSGRSYYTTNCQSSGTPQPYVRSCSQITRCARG